MTVGRLCFTELFVPTLQQNRSVVEFKEENSRLGVVESKPPQFGGSDDRISLLF